MSHYEQRSTVVVNGEHIPTDDVEFLDIEEDVMGRDVMTFTFNGEKYTSNVFTR